METNPEHENKSETYKDDAGKNFKASKADKVSQKLNLIAGYVLDGFAPVVAALALILVVMNFQSAQSSYVQTSQANAKLEKLSAELAVSKSELEKLKNLMMQEKLNKEKDFKIQEERTNKVTQNVSQLQIKMKISPTLEEQLHPVSPLATSAALPPVVVSTGTSKKH